MTTDRCTYVNSNTTIITVQVFNLSKEKNLKMRDGTFVYSTSPSYLQNQLFDSCSFKYRRDVRYDINFTCL